MKIDIITTPNGELKETGMGSLLACNSFTQSTTTLHHEAVLHVCKTVADLDAIVAGKPDVVVLAVKYLEISEGETVWLSDYFEGKSVNFTGSLSNVIKFYSNKEVAKTQMRKQGVPTANSFTAIPGQYKTAGDIPIHFPLFIKPIDSANGNGVDALSFAEDFPSFENKIQLISDRFKCLSMVETYLGGREFTVAVIRKSEFELLISPIEIIPPLGTNGIRILGEEVKKNDSEELALIDDEVLLSSVKFLAERVFIELGARDFARIDIKCDAHGECFFLEANLTPGMTHGSSYFPRACELVHELSYNEVVEIMLMGALSRIPRAMLRTERE